MNAFDDEEEVEADDHLDADADLTGDEPAMQVCPSCGTSVYEDTQSCPRCGEWIIPEDPGSRRRAWIFAAVAMLLIAALVLLTVS